MKRRRGTIRASRRDTSSYAALNRTQKVMPKTLAERAQSLLAAWDAGLLTDEQIVAWADSNVAAIDALDIPVWLSDLSIYGPARCWQFSESDFLPRQCLGYPERFAIRASRLNLQDSAAIREFVLWVSDACHGQDIDACGVRFGYNVDHLLNDCNQIGHAMQYVRQEVPKLLEECRSLAHAIIDLSVDQ